MTRGPQALGRSNPRLYPPLHHPRRAVLTGLRKAVEGFIDARVRGRGSQVLVDLGAGACPYRELFVPHVERYTTVDLPGAGADVDVAPDGSVPLPDRSADLLLSNQVLEHVEHPAAHVRELARLLKTGGFALLSTHGYWMYHPAPIDLWRWTGAGLRRLVADAGLETVETVGVLGRAAAGLQLVHDGVVDRLHPRLRPLLALGLTAAMFMAEHLDVSDRENDSCVFVLTLRRSGE